MCLHKRIIFTSPFLLGRGPGGWCERPIDYQPTTHDCANMSNGVAAPAFQAATVLHLVEAPVQPADPVKPSDIGIAFIGLLPILFILLMLTVVIPGFMG